MIYGGIFMAIIRPSADLRNHYKEMSDLCKTTNEPVFITVNGKEDTVLLSIEALDELEKTIMLMQRLNKGLNDVKNGRVTSLEDMIKKYSV